MKRQLCLLLSFTLLLAACGGDESTPDSPTAQATPSATALSRPPTRIPAEERPWFGIGFNQLIPDVLSILVDSGGPAEQAGMQSGDIITSINGIDVSPANIAEVLLILASAIRLQLVCKELMNRLNFRSHWQRPQKLLQLSLRFTH